ncbi:MAG: hypothetical protein ACON4R_00370 [Akkermansiaceae bacterium]
MKKTTFATLCTLLLAGSGFSRVWTNSDGTKTFEGEFVSCNEKTVTVKRGRREMTFKMELLSEADQKWAKEEQAKNEAAEAREEGAAEFAESALGKALAKASRLEEGQFVDHEITAPPKFFLLYYSASW